MPHADAPMRAPWQPLGAVDPGQLAASRLVAHQAVQLLASFGQTLVEARADDSHRSLTWDTAGQAFQSETSPDGFQALVSLPEFTLELRRQGGLVAAMELNGRTVEEARHWLGAAVGHARSSDALAMAWPEYDVPEPPAGAGAPLAPDSAALAELARWYSDAALVLGDVLAGSPEASQVRCWPHHFDLATLLTFPATGAGDEASHVGVGLSPGDESRDVPYVYVNGWPSPDPEMLPPITGAGHWNTEGWVGAVLPAEAVVTERRPDEQAELVGSFVEKAVAAMRDVMLSKRNPPPSSLPTEDASP